MGGRGGNPGKEVGCQGFYGDSTGQSSRFLSEDESQYTRVSLQGLSEDYTG